MKRINPLKDMSNRNKETSALDVKCSVCGEPMNKVTAHGVQARICLKDRICVPENV